MKTLAVSFLVAAVSALGQAPGSATPAKPIPHTADGKPDFTGAWQGGGVSLYGESVGNTRATAAVPQAPLAAVPGRSRNRQTTTIPPAGRLSSESVFS